MSDHAVAFVFAASAFDVDAGSGTPARRRIDIIGHQSLNAD
jgi:hypothetical protein